MSEKYQQFRAFLANLKNNLKQSTDGVFIPEKLTALLKNKGVILVSAKDVRRIDFACRQLQIASDAIESALAALNGFEDISKVELINAQAVPGEYRAVLADIVKQAYSRRMQAVKAAA